jgi:hypothetical protein
VKLEARKPSTFIDTLFMTDQKSAKFICLVYFDGKKLHAMSEAEKRDFDASSLAYDQALQKRGHYIIAEALHSPKAARTVVVRGKKVSVRDGLVTEAKEPLGGFILIRARDMEEAEKIAAGIPLAKLGSIEVRPIYEF